MGSTTRIDWADATWNPATGCLHGCEYCYARNIVHRFGGNTDSQIHTLETRQYKDGTWTPDPYPFGFAPTFHKYRLHEPLRLKKPRTIFVCSMADLFGDWVPLAWIQEVFEACKAAPRHRYIFLTKHPAKLIEYANRHPGEINIHGENWLFGTTINVTADMNGRGLDLANFAPYSHNTGGRFLSIEPIQEEFTGTYLHNLSCFDWIIVGAETGNRKGKVKPDKRWIMKIADMCEVSSVPVFMKDSLREIVGNDFRQEFPWVTP